MSDSNPTAFLEKKDASSAAPVSLPPTDKMKASREAKADEVSLKKPFPWPLLLVFVVPLGVSGILFQMWDQQEVVSMFRVGWVALCSVVPVMATMVVIGSLAQIRQRPLLSFLSLVLGGAMLWGCWWGYRQVMEYSQSLLR